MYPGDPGPLGNECAGVISAIGRRRHRPARRRRRRRDGRSQFRDLGRRACGADGAQAAGDWLSSQAATVPVTFLTAQYALRRAVRTSSRGDRVLIHAITGGVGMAALQLALRAGAEVFGTAGTPAKRALALLARRAPRRRLALACVCRRRHARRPAAKVWTSCSIRSPATSSLRASRLLRRGGRFRRDRQDRHLGPARRWPRSSPGIDYHALYLGEVAAARPLFVRGMLAELLADIAAGTLAALPHRAYPIDGAEQAFRFMGAGSAHRQNRHHAAAAAVDPRRRQLSRHRRPRRPRPRCARWLAGAGRAAPGAAGRRAPMPAARAAYCRTARLPASRYALRRRTSPTRRSSQRLLADIDTTMPPLRGVLHAAGIVDDAMLSELSGSVSRAVMAPKVRGSWHLHDSTAHRARSTSSSCSRRVPRCWVRRGRATTPRRTPSWTRSRTGAAPRGCRARASTGAAGPRSAWPRRSVTAPPSLGGDGTRDDRARTRHAACCTRVSARQPFAAGGGIAAGARAPARDARRRSSAS